MRTLSSVTLISILLIMTGTKAFSQENEHLQEILTDYLDSPEVPGLSFAIIQNGQSWAGAAGNLKTDTPVFMASATKLIITALVLQLKAEEKLSLEDPVTKYLPADVTSRLHVIDGIDYSSSVTIRHLLSHTSGLPDYFEDEQADGSSLQDDLFNGNDQSWTFTDCIQWSKEMEPQFIPGKKGKAHYSDTNFQLLGRILENLTGMPLENLIIERIAHPLQLKSTWLYKDPTDQRPAAIYHNGKPLSIPKAMVSFGPDGGLVSTPSDFVRFLKAFFTGDLFPIEYLTELQQWNSIFFPMQSGLGIQRIHYPWFMDPFGLSPDLIGYVGLSGVVAVYNPENQIFIVGTSNQVTSPSVSFRLVNELLNAVKAK
ncbi:MAG: beta-lactamase family protein [Bacteroidetes bacterium]|nr:beta-lactamase family protein [Bacteroidota bacterium]